MNRNRLYWIVSCACLSGYVWLFTNKINSYFIDNNVNSCLIKQVTGMPCPSCGSTRSILSILNGDIGDSLQWNPLGFILALIMIAAPLLIMLDLLKQKNMFHTLYNQIESMLKKKWISIPAVMLILSNWIWNICKGL